MPVMRCSNYSQRQDANSQKQQRTGVRPPWAARRHPCRQSRRHEIYQAPRAGASVPSLNPIFSPSVRYSSLGCKQRLCIVHPGSPPGSSKAVSSGLKDHGPHDCPFTLTVHMVRALKGILETGFLNFLWYMWWDITLWFWKF